MIAWQNSFTYMYALNIQKKGIVYRMIKDKS